MHPGIILPNVGADMMGLKAPPLRPRRISGPLTRHGEALVRRAFDSAQRMRPLLPHLEVPLARLRGLPATVDELRDFWRGTGRWPSADGPEARLTPGGLL